MTTPTQEQLSRRQAKSAPTGKGITMTIITIEGRVGAGAYLLSRAVALEMGIDFVDRLVLADVARRVGVTMGALVDNERRVPTFTSRLAQGIQRMLQKSAVAGLGGDPYFGPGIDTLLARPYSEMEESPATAAEEIDEQHFIDTAASVIRDIAEVGNCVSTIAEQVPFSPTGRTCCASASSQEWRTGLPAPCSGSGWTKTPPVK